VLRRLPGVDAVLGWAAEAPGLVDVPSSVLKKCVRAVLAQKREKILAGQAPAEHELDSKAILAVVPRQMRPWPKTWSM